MSANIILENEANTAQDRMLQILYKYIWFINQII